MQGWLAAGQLVNSKCISGHLISHVHTLCMWYNRKWTWNFVCVSDFCLSGSQIRTDFLSTLYCNTTCRVVHFPFLFHVYCLFTRHSRVNMNIYTGDFILSTHTHTHTTHMPIHTCTHVFMHTLTYPHTHTHTHTHTPLISRLLPANYYYS